LNRVACLDASRRAGLFRETADRMGLRGCRRKRPLGLLDAETDLHHRAVQRAVALQGWYVSVKSVRSHPALFRGHRPRSGLHAAGFVGDRDPPQPGLSRTRQLRLRVSAGAPGSRLPSGGEIRRPHETECRRPLKTRGARKRVATLSERCSLVKL